MVGNIMIDTNTVNIDNNVSFTLNWDEPFDNFVPIVNYTITINCNDASCPVMFTVTITSANVSFITDLSMMTPLSVTATNTIGTSDPTTIMIAGKLTYMRMYCMHMYTVDKILAYILYVRMYVWIHIPMINFIDEFYLLQCFVKHAACIITITCCNKA